MADTQTLDGIYKDFYEDYVSEGANNKNKLKDLTKTEDIPFGGREVKWSAHVGRNQSPMGVAEGGAFAEAGQQSHIQTSIYAKKLMARVELTPEAIADSLKSEFAFTSARKDEMNRLVDDIARREEQWLCQDGRGVLALANEADPTSNTTLILDSPGGIAGANFGNRYISEGMYVALVNPATGALRASSARKVLAASSDGLNVTLESAPTNGADNDYVVQAANGSITDVLDTGFEAAFWGLPALIDDGTYRNDYFGINRTLYPSHASYVKASAGAYSVDVLQQSADVVDQKLNGVCARLLMHPSTRRLHIAATQADRRYIQQNLQKPDPGTAAFTQGDLTLGEVPITTIRDLALDHIYGLDEGFKITQYVSEKGKWEDTDGSVLVRVGSGSSARHKFEAWYYCRKQNVYKEPGKSFRVDGVTGQSLVVVRAI
jgi:hypothetical protein